MIGHSDTLMRGRRSNAAALSWMSAMRCLTAASGSPKSAYQTRYAFATLALQSGEQIGWVSKQLGHTTDEMVIRHYAKFIPNLTRQDGSALVKVMRAQGLR